MIDIENLRCGFVEMKLLDKAHILNSESKEVFQFDIKRNEKGKLIEKSIFVENRKFRIFSRFDGFTSSVYLAIDSNKEVLAVRLTKSKTEFTLFSQEDAALSYVMEEIF